MKFAPAFLKLICLAMISSAVVAAVPPVMNFQGVLKDGLGNPVSDGPYTVTFRIFDAPAGGTLLWTETNGVGTVDGLFDVTLGLSNPIPDSVFNNPDRWMGIQVAADPEMTPRQRLGSVAYAFREEPWTSTGPDISRLNGKIGIGTPASGPKVDIYHSVNVPFMAVALNASVSNDADVRGAQIGAVTAGLGGGGADGIYVTAGGAPASTQAISGVTARSSSLSSSPSIGVSGEGSGFGTGYSYGGVFSAYPSGPAWGYGLSSYASANVGWAHGLYSQATGQGACYGVLAYGNCTGGSSGWGGWFEGFGFQGIGAYGSGATYGLQGRGTGTGTGVYAEGFMGVYGYSNSIVGVYGSAPGLTGVSGYGGNAGGGIGVYGNAAGAGSYAGYFQGDFLATGTKSAAVKTDNGQYHLMYAQESPENWFEDFGTARVVDGRAVVTLDPMYAQTVNTRVDYHVFLTPEGDCRGLYISRKAPGTFEIRELQGGTSSLAVSYRIVAKRKGYEKVRLPEMAGTSPEKIGAQMTQLSAEQDKLRAATDETAEQVKVQRIKMEQQEQERKAAQAHGDQK